MRQILAIVTAVLLSGLPAAAAEPLDLLFSTPHLAGSDAGTHLSYRHLRESSRADVIGPDHDQIVTLDVGTGEHARDRAITVVLDAYGAPRTLEEFRGVPGNPILMVFLESTVRAVSRATGGSPFYLRNRIKDGLRDGLADQAATVDLADGPAEARVISLRPFENDENAARLGGFRDLELRFTLAEQAPGMFVALRAETPAGGEPAFVEEFSLDTSK